MLNKAFGTIGYMVTVLALIYCGLFLLDVSRNISIWRGFAGVSLLAISGVLLSVRSTSYRRNEVSDKK